MSILLKCFVAKLLKRFCKFGINQAVLKIRLFENIKIILQHIVFICIIMDQNKKFMLKCQRFIKQRLKYLHILFILFLLINYRWLSILYMMLVNNLKRGNFIHLRCDRAYALRILIWEFELRCFVAAVLIL